MSFYTATKIIATLGPATSSPAAIARLIKAGVNIFRLNFSHGDFEFHRGLIEMVRGQSEKSEIPVGIMQDLPGPKIRVGGMPPGGIELRRGQEITLSCGIKSYRSGEIPVQYSAFCRDIKRNDHIYINDGAIRLHVLSVKNLLARCRVEIGGILTSNKGINLPGTKISAPPLTARDMECVKFGIDQKVDFIAMSFVRSGDDIKSLRRFIGKNDGNQFIIAKIEKREAIDDFDNIIAQTDGVMIARGDLGIELPIEQVPGVQKELIARCNRIGRPVITATQVLESMTNNPRPTRAEATDAANAILDGADAIMLSGETAVGNFPVEAVKTLKAISQETEKKLEPRFPAIVENGCSNQVAECVARAVCEMAHDLGIRLIAAPTRTGHTARLISRFRPNSRIIAFSQNHTTRQQLLLSWGVESMAIDQRLPFDKLINRVKKTLVEHKKGKRGERIIITAGSPGSAAGETNLLMVERL
jgi:pyruvate kinase